MWRSCNSARSPISGYFTWPGTTAQLHSNLAEGSVLRVNLGEELTFTAITEARWDSSPDCNAVTEGYPLFRKDKPAKRGGGVALCVRQQLEHNELCLGVDEERVESLWVGIKGQAHTGDTVVGVYYRPPEQEEEVNEAFYRQLKAASPSQVLISRGLQPPRHQLGRAHSQAHAVQEAPAEH